MKNNFIFLFTILFLSACSPQQRIARIAEKYNLKQFETVVYKDTIYIPEKVYNLDTQIDTAGNFYKKTEKYKIQGKVKNDTVYIKFTTSPDTVYIEKQLNIETIKVQTVEKNKGVAWWKIIAVCIAGCFVFVVYKYFTRK